MNREEKCRGKTMPPANREKKGKMERRGREGEAGKNT